MTVLKTDSLVVVTVLIKGATSEATQVTFEESSLAASIKTPSGSDYVFAPRFTDHLFTQTTFCSLDIELWHKIVPAESSFRIAPMKV